MYRLSSHKRDALQLQACHIIAYRRIPFDRSCTNVCSSIDRRGQFSSETVLLMQKWWKLPPIFIFMANQIILARTLHYSFNIPQQCIQWDPAVQTSHQSFLSIRVTWQVLLCNECGQWAASSSWPHHSKGHFMHSWRDLENVILADGQVGRLRTAQFRMTENTWLLWIHLSLRKSL